MADHGRASGALVGDEVVERVGLGGADDAEGRLLATGVLDLDGTADGDRHGVGGVGDTGDRKDRPYGGIAGNADMW